MGQTLKLVFLGPTRNSVTLMKTHVTPPEWRVPIAGYLAYIGNRPESTRKLRSYHLRRYANETGLTPRTTTYETLLGYLRSHNWSNSSQHSQLSTFRSFWRWALLVAKIVDEDPTALLPSTSPSIGKPRPAPELAVVEALHTVEDRRVQLMIEIAATAGLRCCEISRLHTGDLFEDLEGWSIRIVGKGGRPRDVPISGLLASKLREIKPGWVFPGQVDGHLSAAYVSKLISRALPPGVTAHMLRHLFAAQAYLGAQRDIRAVQDLLGHRSVSTTQVYTQVPAGAKRAGVDRAAELLLYGRVSAA